jgi:hypothetical protein
MPEYDVIVIGAGQAGVVSGYALRTTGLSFGSTPATPHFRSIPAPESQQPISTPVAFSLN